jgi:beta-lactamase superfamily II metal-dependent hydrolase
MTVRSFENCSPRSVSRWCTEYADRLSLSGVDPNEAAGVLLLEMPLPDGGCRRALLTADVQLTGISLMLARDQSLLRADVLKYPHHGCVAD